MQQRVPLQVPLAVIRDLRCRHCTGFVSCGPVFVVPDGGILCGRCSLVAKPQFRNGAYETLADAFLYPCRNWHKHCNAQLQWNEAIVHEQQCSFDSSCNIFCSHPSFFFKHERKISVRGDFQLQHVPDRMLLHLQCNVCFRYLSCDPVYIREDGKNICHRCIHNNGIPEGVLRNLAYEKLAAATIFPCVYKSKGCTMRLPYGKDLWRHESDCSYGQQTPKRLTSTKQKSGPKERGVIATHSGHYYGTITPNAALWAPAKPEKIDPNIEVNKEFLMRKHAKNEDSRYTEYSRFGSNATTAESSRRTSASSDNRTSGESKDPITPPSTQFSHYVDDRTIYQNHDDFPRFSIQTDHTRREDIPRASLPGGSSHLRRHMGNHSEEEPAFRSLDYAHPMPSKSVPNELIQPKRGDSFRMGNSNVINELKMRQKRVKRRASDGESIGSEETLDSLTISEAIMENQPPMTQ